MVQNVVIEQTWRQPSLSITMGMQANRYCHLSSGYGIRHVAGELLWLIKVKIVIGLEGVGS